MRLSLNIYLFIFLSNFLLAQDTYDTTLVISGISDISALDSQYPSLSSISPSDGENFNSGENILVSWDAADYSFTDNCINIFISYNLGENYNNIFENISNVGQTNYQLADINSQFVRLKIKADDYYGNSSTLLGDNYFTVGYDPDWDFEPPDWQETEDVSVEVFFDSSFVTGISELDSKYPLLDIIDPNGGEVFDSGENISVNWQAVDETFTEEAISIYFSENLGDNFDLLYGNISNSGSMAYDLPSINSAFARFKLSAIDSYGNKSIDIADNYFQIGTVEMYDSDYSFESASYDTSFSNNELSDIGTVDSDYPFIQWLYPNGGEQFDNFETVTVEWSAEDESFGDEAISIYLSTELGGYYNSVADGVPNTESLDIDLPSADEAFARFKVAAVDTFGNTSEDYEDNYFILGDPFGEYNVNPLDDIVVIDWGWGEYQMIYVENDALDFLSDGDEIHVIDQNGIITEDCAYEGAYGVVSVASHEYIPQLTTPYPLYTVGGSDYCEESEYIVPGYVEGNPIYFAHYDESESTLNYLDPEYDSGNGLFGVEFEDTLRFQYYDESANMVYDIFETIIYFPMMIEGDAIDPVQLHIDYSTGVNTNPNWSVNYGDYMFNGVIHSTILNGEEIIIEENDRIAAFVNSVCRGTTETMLAPDGSPFQDVFELQVYGDIPVTLVTSFTESVARSSDLEIMYSTSDRELNQFNVYRNNAIVAESISEFYYMDETTESGQDYCYQIMLLDDEGNELLESMEQCIAIEASYILGDLNQDGSINVLDVVMVVDLILNNPNPSEMEMLLGDLNSDGFINVLDIVMIMDIILGGSLARENPTHEASFLYGNGHVNYKSDGKLAGVQLEVIGDFEITDNHLPDGWEIANSEGTIIMYSLDGSGLKNKTLFEYTGELTIESAIAADWHRSEIMVNSMLLPRDFALSPAYPNPFNPVTNIRFSLPFDSEVSVSIYNLQGREVSMLIDGNMDAGYHSVIWNANSYSSGVYFVKMVAGEFVNTQKLMLVK